MKKMKAKLPSLNWEKWMVGDGEALQNRGQDH